MSLLANSMARAESAQAMARIVEIANERLESILDAYFPPLWCEGPSLEFLSPKTWRSE